MEPVSGLIGLTALLGITVLELARRLFFKKSPPPPLFDTAENAFKSIARMSKADLANLLEATEKVSVPPRDMPPAQN